MELINSQSGELFSTRDYLNQAKQAEQHKDRLDKIASWKSGISTATDPLNPNNEAGLLSPEGGVKFALNSLPPLRRTSELSSEIEERDYFRAFGIVGIMLANFPEDWRDIKKAWEQVKSKFTGEKYVTYETADDHKTHQHPFSTTRGTLFEPLLDIQKDKSGGLGYRLYRNDVPLFDTKLGKFLRNLFKIEIDLEKTKTLQRKDKFEIPVEAYSFKTKGVREYIGRAMLRMPKPTMFLLGGLEVPTIVKAFYENEEHLKEGTKQTLKSALFVLLVQSGIGLGGAIGFKKWGAAASLAGMGAGSILGSQLAKKLDEKL